MEPQNRINLSAGKLYVSISPSGDYKALMDISECSYEDETQYVDDVKLVDGTVIDEFTCEIKIPFRVLVKLFGFWTALKIKCRSFKLTVKHRKKK